MSDEIFAYLNLKLYEDGRTIFDMEGTNENLLYGVAAILAKMILETEAPRKEVTKIFLEQIKEDINDIIDSNAWGENIVKNNVIPFSNK